MPYNVQYDLRGKKIQDTYSQVLQYDTASMIAYLGRGDSVTINSTSASFATKAYSASLSSHSSTCDNASFANQASNATLASLATFAGSSSYSLNADTASYVATSSYSTTAATSSY